MNIGPFLIELQRRKWRILRLFIVLFLGFGYLVPEALNAQSDWVVALGFLYVFFASGWAVIEAWQLVMCLVRQLCEPKDLS